MSRNPLIKCRKSFRVEGCGFMGAAVLTHTLRRLTVRIRGTPVTSPGLRFEHFAEQRKDPLTGDLPVQSSLIFEEARTGQFGQSPAIAHGRNKPVNPRADRLGGIEQAPVDFIADDGADTTN